MFIAPFITPGVYGFVGNRGRGGAAVFDFTQMSAAELLAEGWVHSRDTAGYVPKADGDYLLKAAGEPFHTTDGVHLPGAFTNLVPNSSYSGASAPNTLPTGMTLYRLTNTAVELTTHKGLPALHITGNKTAKNNFFVPNQSFSVAPSTLHTYSAFAAVSSNGAYTESPWHFLQYNWYGDNGRVAITLNAPIARYRTTLISPSGTPIANFRVSGPYDTNDGETGQECTLAGQQAVALGVAPSVIVLSSAATTPSSQEKLTLVRPVQTPVSYGVLAKTAAGDPGHDQVIFCHGSSASHYVRLIRETSTRKIRWQVVNNGVSVCNLDLGSVADETWFSCAVRAATDDFAGVIDAGAAVTDTAGEPPPNLTTLYLGRHRDDTLPFWGVVRYLRIA